MEREKMDIGIALLIGIFVGVGSFFLGTKSGAPKGNDDKTSETQQEIIKQLTDLDIVEKICIPEKENKESSLLCRELTCLVYTRGIDSKTSGNQCEEISNIANSIKIIDYCIDKKESLEDVEKCFDVFYRRK